MKRIGKGFLFFCLTSVVIGLAAGCGGGGGGATTRYITGSANIHHDSRKPIVGLVDLTASGSPTIRSMSLSTSSSGWQWKDFSITEPSKPSSVEVYALACWDDADGNGRYKTSELLGFADMFVGFKPATGTWRVYSGTGTDLGSPFEYSFEIACTYRSASSSTSLSSIDSTSKAPLMTREEAQSATEAMATKLAQQ